MKIELVPLDAHAARLCVTFGQYIEFDVADCIASGALWYVRKALLCRPGAFVAYPLVKHDSFYSTIWCERAYDGAILGAVCRFMKDNKDLVKCTA
jgi:hypothetical protein